MILPTELLKKMVDDITTIKRYNTFQMKVMLRNHQDTSFKIDDAIVDLLTIDQNFMANTTDHIQLTVNLTPIQLQSLVVKQSDLYADIVIEYANNITNEIILDEEPLHLQYKVLIHDLSNIMKRFGVNAFVDTDNTKNVKETENAVYVRVDMQLIKDTEYKTNRASFIGMIRNCNVEEGIKYMASVMGIPKLKLSNPDNEMKYNHLVIPPEYGDFRAAFDYIQSKYGVYSNGFRHYMTDSVLHIYPPFDMEPERDPKLEILRVSENTYVGMNNYHDLDGTTVKIISNTALNSKTLTNVGSENKGNAKVFIRSDSMLDGQVSKANMSLNGMAASLSSKADNSIAKGSAVARYVKPTINVHGHASSFSETNTELMGLGWPNARIGMIEPGMATSFIFDEKDSVMVKQGIVETMQYTISRATRLLFQCSATIMLRVDPEQKPYET